MFKLVAERKVKAWPVSISVPVDGGKVETFDMTIDLKLVDSKTFNELSRKGDAEMFSEVITGWSGIADESGESLVFTPENLKAACLNPHFTAGALSAYLKAMSGQASIKNS